jgi:ADP-ribosylglycohydrolase
MVDAQARYVGAAVGAFVGDALAMPAHWYYDRNAIRADYGIVDGYHAPRRLHPNSILWRSSYEPTEPEYDILGDERVYWGRKGVHYHQHLRPGENTVNLKLLRLALDLVFQSGEYDPDRYTSEYTKFLLAPAEHHDTYLEECHRGFFLNLRAGRSPDACALTEKHIGGLVSVVPLYAALRAIGEDDDPARAAVRRHVSVTHGGDHIRAAVDTLLVLAAEVWGGSPLKDALGPHLDAQDLPFLQGPIKRLASEHDENVIGGTWSPACYLDESMPATFYLAWKYSDAPRKALIANVMVGGDNCHRGAVLGALFGLAAGEKALPEEWRTGLIGHVPVPEAARSA